MNESVNQEYAVSAINVLVGEDDGLTKGTSFVHCLRLLISAYLFS